MRFGTGLLRRANARWMPGHMWHAPEWVILGVNNLCNLHCRMCDVGTGFDASNFHFHQAGAHPVDMPLELIEDVLRQIGKSWPQTRVSWAFTEPLIYPHTGTSLALATELGLTTTLITNGLHLPRHAAMLCDAGLDELAVSLDGPPGVHDAIRGAAGSFDKAIEGLHRLFEQPTPPSVRVFCAITPWNTGHLGALLVQLSALPLAGVGFMHTTFTTPRQAREHNRQLGDRWPAAPSSLADLDLDDIDLLELAAEIEAIRSRTWPWPVSFAPDLAGEAGLQRYYRRPQERMGSCRDAFRAIMVKSDGTVIPAHSRCYRVVAGNVHQQSLVELWNAPELMAFRKGLAANGGLLPACTRCCSAFA